MSELEKFLDDLLEELGVLSDGVSGFDQMECVVDGIISAVVLAQTKLINRLAEGKEAGQK